MTDAQWQDLLCVLKGKLLVPLPVGLIVDSPWLPGWGGVSMIDYFSDDATWLQVNLQAVRRFDSVWLLPGFWAEYGMCTEPSAFGAKCVWCDNAFPTVEKILPDYEAICHLKKPSCRTDGLLPFVVRRLERCRRAIEAAGHRIRFATARGPLNIASFLLGHTEFLLGIKTNPEEIHCLLSTITEFLIDWIAWQTETFDSIEGIFLLDDLAGFLRDDDFQQFALPYLKRIYQSQNVAVRFLHNDASGVVTARHLQTIGVNLFNFSFRHDMGQMRAAAGPSVTLLGNIPPRDILAQATSDEVRSRVREMLSSVADKRRIIISCGGGTAPGTPVGNIEALAGEAVSATAQYEDLHSTP